MVSAWVTDRLLEEVVMSWMTVVGKRSGNEWRSPLKAVVLVGVFVISSTAAGQPDQAKHLGEEILPAIQEYLVIAQQCETLGAADPVGKHACASKLHHAEKVRAQGLEPEAAKERIFKGCAKVSGAMNVAMKAKEQGQTEEEVRSVLRSHPDLPLNEREVDVFVSLAFDPVMQPNDGVARSPIWYAHYAENVCRYGTPMSIRELEQRAHRAAEGR